MNTDDQQLDPQYQGLKLPSDNDSSLDNELTPRRQALIDNFDNPDFMPTLEPEEEEFHDAHNDSKLLPGSKATGGEEGITVMEKVKKTP